MEEDCPSIVDSSKRKNSDLLGRGFDEVGWLQKADVCVQEKKLCTLCSSQFQWTDREDCR